MKRVLIMAAGTGGHVFPALAVAKKFKDQGIDVIWLATHQGMEVKWVTSENIPIFPIDIGGLRGKGVLAWLMLPIKFLRALIQSMRIISNTKPNLVLGMGGFVCGPGGVAAYLLNTPLVIHEQNAIPGLTNQCLANFLTRGKPKPTRGIKVLAAFSNSFSAKIKAILTGNPVREELLQFEPPEKRWQNRSGRLKILVLGGSRGAQSINQVVPKAIALMPPAERPDMYHQTGDTHIEATQRLYEQEAVGKDENQSVLAYSNRVVSFIDDMAKAYLWADLVICRAGAITLAELCNVGIGSILIPFPHAVDDHQTKNAEYLIKAGAAILLPQTQLTAEALAKQLTYFSVNHSKVIDMANRAYSLRTPDATEKVVEQCKEYIS